ncbi:MAG: inositol monophosphatase family protein, partial [Candidatus Nanohaloarchaea archaeon]
AMLGKAPRIAENAWKYWCNDYGSSGHHFALVAEGTRDGFITGGHGYVKEKKTGEEIAGMQLLVDEAGGAVTDWSGEDIGSLKIRLPEGKNHDVIAAATDDLAGAISEEIIPSSYR